jgi:hypothetical protein
VCVSGDEAQGLGNYLGMGVKCVGMCYSGKGLLYVNESFNCVSPEINSQYKIRITTSPKRDVQ